MDVLKYFAPRLKRLTLVNHWQLLWFHQCVACEVMIFLRRDIWPDWGFRARQPSGDMLNIRFFSHRVVRLLHGCSARPLIRELLRKQVNEVLYRR
jgi:hypothetical protein